MNDFVAKKLGEILAFAEVGRETFELQKASMEVGFGIERVAQIVRDNLNHTEAIRKIAHENGVTEIVQDNLIETSKKLRAMSDVYLNLQNNKNDTENKTNDSTKLLEWCGFFEGAAIVHWSNLVGMAEKLLTTEHNLTHDDLILLANSGLELHYGILHEATEHLHKIGGERAVNVQKEIQDLTE